MPSAGWSGVLDGGQPHMMCVQVLASGHIMSHNTTLLYQGFPDPETTHDSWEEGSSAFIGQEDCLVVNGYTTGRQL